MGRIATFDKQTPDDMVNFGIGQPSADLMPVELFRALTDGFLAGAAPMDFNYGEVPGDVRFRSSLARFLCEAYGSPTDPDALFLTAGNSQALDFVCGRFTEPGDVIFVEEPSYFLAFQIFRDHGLDIVGLPMDEGGLRIDALEAALERYRPKMLYTIPSFANPGGQCLGLERRERLVALSREHDFLVVADEVYQLLPCFGAAPPALGTMTDRGCVLSLGSFSKILAPGLRVSWIQTSPDLMETLLESGWVNSGGAINQLASHLVREAIDSGRQAAHIDMLKAAYRERLLAMDAALDQHLGDIARWQRPDGGYFFWVELPSKLDAMALRNRARAAGVGFQPGPLFSPTGRFPHHLRLSFAHYGVDDITQGVARLADVIRASHSAHQTGR